MCAYTYVSDLRACASIECECADVFGGRGNDGVFVHLNLNSSGLFATPLKVANTGAHRMMEVGHLDGDLFVDVAVCTSPSPSQLLWYRGRGNGSFFSGISVPMPDYNYLDLDIGKLDDDAFADIVLGGNSGGEPVFVFGNGTGFPASSVLVGPTSSGSSLYTVSIVELTGDLRPDVLFSVSFTGSVEFGHNRGSRVFTVRFVGSVPNCKCAGAGDLDADGDADVVAAGTANNLIRFVNSTCEKTLAPDSI